MLLEYISNININIRNLIHNVLGKLWLQLFVSPALDLPFNTSRGSVVMIGMVFVYVGWCRESEAICKFLISITKFMYRKLIGEIL